jgi:hypothetical protein
MRRACSDHQLRSGRLSFWTQRTGTAIGRPRHPQEAERLADHTHYPGQVDHGAVGYDDEQASRYNNSQATNSANNNDHRSASPSSHSARPSNACSARPHLEWSAPRGLRRGGQPLGDDRL